MLLSASEWGHKPWEKGLGSREGTQAFAAPFHAKPHIFLTSTCSLLLMVRLLHLLSLGSDT